MNIRRYREAAGYGQAQLARLIGVEPTTLCRVEHGTRFLSLKRLKKIAELCGCTIDDLIADPVESANDN